MRGTPNTIGSDRGQETPMGACWHFLWSLHPSYSHWHYAHYQRAERSSDCQGHIKRPLEFQRRAGRGELSESLQCPGRSQALREWG